MDVGKNGSPDKQPTLKEVREQRQLIQAQIELRQLQGARQILEAISNPDYYLTAYGDLLDRYRDGGRLAYPLTQPTDRRYGQNYPFWNTETDLSLLRAQARLLCTMNNYAIGLLNGLQAYVIGDGFQYRVVEKTKHSLAKPGKPSSLVAETQDIIEEFCAVNDWHHWEQELFWRSREDGEYFLRYYPDRQLRCLTLRSVEPEQVTTTGLPDPRPEWSFGILTEPEDMQEIYGYNVLYLSDPQNHQNEIREEVPADQIQHFKINVHRLVKRGLTDFCFSTYDALRMAEKLRNNMAEGAAVQSALAFIRQHESATQSQVQNFLNTQQLDFSRLNPLTGRAISYKHIEPGSIADIPRGMQYVQPPGAGNAAGFVEILHASLRGAGCRWNAPEWLATGSGADMAAYTASLTAQAPFVRTAVQKQLSYKKAFKRVIKEAIAVAVDYGRLPPEVFELLDIQVEAPSIPYKSALDEAQANQIRVQGGWKSRQTVQQEEGLDPEREMQNIEEYNRRMEAVDKQRSVRVQEHNFNPNEPRDERGRWTKGSGLAGDAWKELLTQTQLGLPSSSAPPEKLYTAAYGGESPAEPAEQPVALAQYKGRFARIPANAIDHLVDIGLAQRSQAGYVLLVELSPECHGFRRVILQPYTAANPAAATSLTGREGPLQFYRVLDSRCISYEGNDPNGALARMRDAEHVEDSVRSFLASKESIIDHLPKLIDDAITSPPDQQKGPLAAAQGAAVGVYDFVKSAGVGMVQLPQLLQHPLELAENLKHLANDLRELLKDHDYKALQKFDYDLYQLANPAIYDKLTEWEKGRLITRVALKYGTLVEGAAQATKLAGKLGKAALGEVKALAEKVARQIDKEISAETFFGGARPRQKDLRGLRDARNLTPGHLQGQETTCGARAAYDLIREVNPEGGPVNFGGMRERLRLHNGLNPGHLEKFLAENLPEDMFVSRVKRPNEPRLIKALKEGDAIVGVDGNHWVRPLKIFKEDGVEWVRVFDPGRGYYEQRLTSFVSRIDRTSEMICVRRPLKR